MDVHEFLASWAREESDDRDLVALRDRCYEQLGKLLLVAVEQPMSEARRSAFATLAGSIFGEMPQYLRFPVMSGTVDALERTLPDEAIDRIEQQLDVL